MLAGLAVIASLVLAACGSPAPAPTASAPPEPLPSEPLPSESSTSPGAQPPTPAPPITTGPMEPTRPPTTPPGASSSPPSATGLPATWRGVDLERILTERSVVALTFDGGSSDAGVADILATLAERDVPATFFVTGAFARTYPQRVRAMAAAGHPVGNHSDAHLSYPELTDVRIRADVAAAEAAINAASGRPAMPLFRFPFGARTDHDIRVVNDAGYLPVRWSVDSLGWKGTSGGLTVDEVVDRVVSTAVPGHIVLMHVGANPDDGTTLDADALPRIIDGLRALGYGFVDLGDLVD